MIKKLTEQNSEGPQNDDIREEQDTKNFLALGEKWKRVAISTSVKRSPTRNWLKFTENVQGKYSSQGTKFDFMKRRVKDKSTKEQALPYAEDFTQFEPEKEVFPEDDLKKDGHETNIEKENYFTLDQRVKDFLANILNMRIPSMKIYTNQSSDMIVKKFKADAVTYEDKILFKTGKYNLQDKSGIALLGHELTHAAKTRMQSQGMPEYMKNEVTSEAEEKDAVDNEKRVLRYFSSPEVYKGLKEPSIKPSISDSSVRNSHFSSPQGSMPKTALSTRDLNLPPESNLGLNSVTQLSGQQLTLIKDEVYRDIMNRIRTEFERGG